MSSILKTNKLVIGYNKVPVTTAVKFELRLGDAISIHGLPSSGKTSLFRGIFGRAEIIEGSFLLNSEVVVDRRNQLDSWLYKIGVVWNPRELLDNLTVKQMLLMSETVNSSGVWNNPIIESFFNKTPLLTRLNILSSRLSGGERTLLNYVIAINRALGGLLVADDLTASLQPSFVILLVDLLKRFIEQKTIAILFTESNSVYCSSLSNKKLELSLC